MSARLWTCDCGKAYGIMKGCYRCPLCGTLTINETADQCPAKKAMKRHHYCWSMEKQRSFCPQCGEWEHKEEAMDVYEYVIIVDPTPEEKEKGETPKILPRACYGEGEYIGSSAQLVMAENADKARELAVAGLRPEEKALLHRIRILVRPFA